MRHQRIIRRIMFNNDTLYAISCNDEQLLHSVITRVFVVGFVGSFYLDQGLKTSVSRFNDVETCFDRLGIFVVGR